MTDTNHIEVLRELRAEIDGTNYGDHTTEQVRQLAALDAAIAAALALPAQGEGNNG